MSEPSQPTTIQDDEVRERQRQAAHIANKVLGELIQAAVPGAAVYELALKGDTLIREATAKSYIKAKTSEGKPIEKGVAFPTCINVGEMVCHYAPLETDASPALKDGDLVRIDLGVHIDGFLAVAAHTVLVQATPAPIEGRLADLLKAGSLCMEAAVRSLRAGGKNTEIPALWEKIAEAHGVAVCEGVLSHQLQKFVIDGKEVILSKPASDQKVAEVEFKPWTTWSVDVLLSTGTGKLRSKDSHAFVYKRRPNTSFNLKLASSREALKEVTTKFGLLPFALRELDPRAGRLGVSECCKHELLSACPVLYDKNSAAMTAHFKSTVFISDCRVDRVAGLPLAQKCVSEKKVTDEAAREALQRSYVFLKKDPVPAVKKEKKAPEPAKAPDADAPVKKEKRNKKKKEEEK